MFSFVLILVEDICGLDNSKIVHETPTPSNYKFNYRFNGKDWKLLFPVGEKNANLFYVVLKTKIMNTYRISEGLICFE